MSLASSRGWASGRLSISGNQPWSQRLVRNTSAGVDIEVTARLKIGCVSSLHWKNEPPPLARIDEMTVEKRRANGFTGSRLCTRLLSNRLSNPSQRMLAICLTACESFLTLTTARFRYPFINCTNCGPRFTIVEDIPYDRPKTTMASFVMCPDCQAEYQNPLDRRFHAPIACPTCGPQIWLETNEGGKLIGDDALYETQRLLLAGKIVAIKGLGDFISLAMRPTLTLSAGASPAVKLRVDKPFALDAASLDCVETIASSIGRNAPCSILGNDRS